MLSNEHITMFEPRGSLSYFNMSKPGSKHTELVSRFYGLSPLSACPSVIEVKQEKIDINVTHVITNIFNNFHCDFHDTYIVICLCFARKILELSEELSTCSFDSRMCKYHMIPVIQKNFFMGRLDFSITSDKITNLDWHWQRRLLDVTLNHSRVKQYPMSNAYVRSFIKKLINYLENDQDIHDDFYTHLAQVMKDDDEFFYRHYLMNKQLGDLYDEDNFITIKETNRMVVDGTTGMKTWDAAFILANWALNNKNKIMNKKVLELGSGVGFSGIAIADQCSPKSVYLSDFHEQVIQIICENIRINFPHLREEVDNDKETAGRKNFVVAKFKEDKEKVNKSFLRTYIKDIGVVSLDWNQYDDIPIHLKPDVIVGADIIYDPTIIEPLCNLLKRFFERNAALEVYIASVIRNPETFKLFLKTLDLMNFLWEKLEPTHFEYFHWNKNVETSLLKISLSH